MNARVQSCVVREFTRVVKAARHITVNTALGGVKPTKKSLLKALRWEVAQGRGERLVHFVVSHTSLVILNSEV